MAPGTWHPPTGTCEGGKVPASRCLVWVQVSMSGKIGQRYPHPHEGPVHLSDLTELNELGGLTKLIKLGELTKLNTLGELAELIEDSAW